MRTGTLFWGGILVLVGGLLLLSNLGILTVNVWGIVWPSVIILLGLWTLVGVFFNKGAETRHAIVPLEDASRARLLLQHGAGRLKIYAGAGAGNLAEGDFDGGLDVSSHKQGETLEVKMTIPPGVWGFPFGRRRGKGLDWSLGLAQDLPLSLDLETGANEARIDLEKLQVGELRFKSGASSTELVLPANAGATRVEISSGASSIKIRVPVGVAARISYSLGLATFNVDTLRFPRTGDLYQSPDYNSAQNKVDLNVETGVGTVDIR